MVRPTCMGCMNGLASVNSEHMERQGEPMHILCIGMGAVGGYIGGNLIRAGQKVTFLLRSNTKYPLDEYKLEIRERGEIFTTRPECVNVPVDQVLSSRSFDAVILALKTYDIDEILTSFSRIKQPFPPVISFQNGVETEERLAEVIGRENVIPATLTSAISKSGFGQVTVEKKRGIGLANGHEFTRVLLPIFNEAGLNAKIYTNAKQMKWSKMLTNLLCNASSAILSMTPTEVMAHPALYQLEVRQIREALRVMRASGLTVIDLPGVPVKAFSTVFRAFPWQISRFIARKAIASGRGEKMPSLYIDLHRDRKQSEVLALDGAVARYGYKMGINTPVCTLLNNTLLSLVENPAQIGRYDHAPQELLKQLEM
jgi:2-dehydropantoate 2-reductase